MRRYELRDRLQRRLSRLRRFVRFEHEHRLMWALVHSVQSASEWNGNLRRDRLRGHMRAELQTVQRHVHPVRERLQWILPAGHPQLRRPLRGRWQPELVRYVLHPVCRSFERRCDVRRREVRDRVSHRLPGVWNQVHRDCQLLHGIGLLCAGE